MAMVKVDKSRGSLDPLRGRGPLHTMIQWRKSGMRLEPLISPALLLLDLLGDRLYKYLSRGGFWQITDNARTKAKAQSQCDMIHQ